MAATTGRSTAQGGQPASRAHGQPTLDEWFPRVLARHRARLRVTDLALASLLVTRTLHGAMRFAIEERPDLLDSTAFEEELLALVLRYLEASPPLTMHFGAGTRPRA